MEKLYSRCVADPVFYMLEKLENTTALLIPGDQAKKLREVMAAYYLLHGCTHFCMLVFRLVSPSST